MNEKEGSRAVAEAVAMRRPQVICAYPITPQTHIVEALSAMVKKEELKAEFLNVESEFAAMSVAIGASVTGARAYTATASQGLLYMSEAVWNAAGLGLPIVMTVANRAIGAPINIWNDHSDAMSQRDAGWLQLYAETSQEALDLHIQAFRIAADFKSQFGRDSGGLIRPYLTDGAETVVVALGSALGTVKDTVDELRAGGTRIGALGITSFRPFPLDAVREALGAARHVVVLERALAPGTGGIVTADILTALAGRLTPHLSTVIAGLGGRSITRKSLRAMLAAAAAGELSSLTFLDLDTALVDRELARMSSCPTSGPSSTRPAASRSGTGCSARNSAASSRARVARLRKPFAITLDVGSSRANHTGAWRTERPGYVHNLPPCNNACRAGENIQQWLYDAEEGHEGPQLPDLRDTL